jgi:hypothetical protein
VGVIGTKSLVIDHRVGIDQGKRMVMTVMMVEGRMAVKVYEFLTCSN